MENHRLYTVLFNPAYLAPELKDVKRRREIMECLDSMLVTYHYPKLQLLLRNGQVPRDIYFVEKGAVSGFYYDENHNERTIIIWDELSFATDASVFFQRKKTDMNMKVMPDSYLLSISFEDLAEINRRFPETVYFTLCISWQYEAYYKRWNKALRSLDAWHRYLLLIKGHPLIENKITKEIMASFLNVAPSTLSRLLKRKRHP